MATAKVKSKILELPSEIVEKLGLDEGDEFDVALEDDAIVLRRREEKVPDPEQVAQIRAAVAEGLDEYKAGKTIGPFENMDEFEEYLKNSP